MIGRDKLNHHDSYINAISILIVLIDGIGLSIIAACTVLEGADLWNDYFNEYWEEGSSSLGFWMCGHFLQLSGLILLIVYAASFQFIHELETAGMMMLTAGPLLNLISCSLFNNRASDPYFLYNKAWLSNESLELVGIVILDVSMIDDLTDGAVVITELIGFIILMMAAVLEFEYATDSFYPISVAPRYDRIHCSDCIGLLMLTAVSFIQYHLKTFKERCGHSSIHHSPHNPQELLRKHVDHKD